MRELVILSHMNTCKSCQRQYIYDRKKGHNKTLCNSCLVNNRRFKKKIQCLEYKGGKCEKCNYNKCKRALSFHHIDPSKKDFIIAGNHTRKWGIIKQELDKCILLCANCHMEEHEKLELDSGAGSTRAL